MKSYLSVSLASAPFSIFTTTLGTSLKMNFKISTSLYYYLEGTSVDFSRHFIYT